jgi:predicted extracellular nuclease
VENVRVFIPASVAGSIELEKGDRVCITGTVRTYQGEKEIVVQSREEITVRER